MSPSLSLAITLVLSGITEAQSVPCSSITRNPQVLEALIEARSEEQQPNDTITASELPELRFTPIIVQPGDALYVEYKGKAFTVYAEYAGGGMTAFDAPPKASYEEWRKGILMLDHLQGVNQKLVPCLQ